MPRDVSGNYTLPVGNPVVDGTIIDVNWANPTMSDVAVQLNNVLTRDGVLGALNPIKFDSGAVGAPGITFVAEVASGLYRDSAGVIAMAVGGVEKQRWTAAGTQLAGAILFALGAVGAPSIAFIGDTNTGMWSPAADTIAWSVNGAEALRLAAGALTPGANVQIASQLGTVGAPGYSFTGDLNTGMWSPAADTVGVAAGGVDVMRFNTAASGVNYFSMTPSAAASAIALAAAGTDADISINLTPKGTGGLLLPLGATATPSYSFQGDPNTGIWSSAADILNISTNGTERARFASGIKFHGSGSSNGLFVVQDGGVSGLNANSSCDAIVIDSDGNTGITILTSATGTSQIQFGDGGTNNARGGISYISTVPEIRVSASAGVDCVVRHNDAAVSYPIGFRNLPTLGNTATATAVGVGKCYLNTAAITINNGVFAAGDIVTVYNNSAAAFNITQGTITTMRLAGTATTGTRSLAPRGFATLFFVTATEVAVSGNVT